MTPLFKKIHPPIAVTIPWDAMSELFGLLPGINALERELNLSQGTIAKAQRTYPGYTSGNIGISSRVHGLIIESVFRKFSSSDQARAWMKEHWPGKLLEEYGTALEVYYQNIDFQNRLPQIGIYPPDYVVREEQSQMMSLLIRDKQTKVIWITGTGGIGKTTLATGLLRHGQEELRKHFSRIFWINVEQASYREGIEEIASQLNMIGQSVATIEQKVMALGKTSRLLFVLDALHDVADLEKWKSLAGYLGRLIISSRVQLSDHELLADTGIHQIALQGFTKAQSLKFLGKRADAIDQILSITGGHPLALRLLKGLMQNFSADEILSALLSAPLDTIQEQTGELTRKNSLRACFDLTWRIMLEESPPAERYFESIGAFLSHNIPREMLKQVAGPAHTREDWQALAALKKYNLVNLPENHAIVQIHALLHEYARERLQSSPDAKKICERYDETIQATIRETGKDYETTGTVSLNPQWWLPDLAHFARYFSKQFPLVEQVEIGKDLYNLLSSIGKTELLNDWLSELEKMVQDDDAKAWVYNLRGWNALNQANLPLAIHNFTQAHQLLSEQRTTGPEISSFSDEKRILEKASSLNGLARCLLYMGNLQAASNLMLSEQSELVFSRIGPGVTSLQKDLLLAEIYLENQNLDQARPTLAALQRNPMTRKHLAIKSEIISRWAEYYMQQQKFARAIRLLTCISHSPRIPPMLRCEYGLELVSCLGQSQQYNQAKIVLQELEPNLIDDPKFQARFWKQTALVEYFLENFTDALQAATTALTLWKQVPDSSDEQEKIQALIAELRSKISPQK